MENAPPTGMTTPTSMSRAVILNIGFALLLIMTYGSTLTFLTLLGLAALFNFSERRRVSEAATHKQELNFKVALEAAPSGMIVVDTDGKIIFANHQAQLLFGYALEELLDKPIEILVTALLKNGHPQLRRTFMKNPQPRAMGKGRELHGRKKDGTEFPVEIGLAPMQTPNGVFIISTIEDITEQTKANEERRLFADLVRDADNAIIIKNLDGTIQSWNPAAEKIFGYTEKEIVGRNIKTIIPPQYQKEELGIFKKITEGQRIEHFESKRLCKDGRVIDVSLSIAPIKNARGAVVGASKMLRDITEQKKAEQLIQASLREKDVLIKEIHHRVINNLNVVLSLLDLQADAMNHDSALQAIHNSQSRIRSIALIHENLFQSKDVAKIDFGEYVESLLHSVFATYHIDPNQHALKIDIPNIQFGIDTATPCSLIINELVVNSINHAFPNGKHGEIFVKLGKDNQGKFELLVGDNGIGFSNDFDFRKTKKLGMQLVMTLVKQLNGTIERIESPGTVFKISFYDTQIRSRTAGAGPPFSFHERHWKELG